MRGFLACTGLVATLAAASPADAANRSVDANGNFLLGGLSFTPARVEVKAGDFVRWTNTDFLVPHTATEVNGLWDLTGAYGGTPFNPPGFGPGESRSRRFEAGTFSYLCAVHPDDMRGTVAVKPRTRIVRRHRNPGLAVVWARRPAPAGQVFDVQRRRRGKWKTVRDGTRKLAGRFPGTDGKFRARVRFADGSAASGWSPPAGR